MWRLQWLIGLGVSAGSLLFVYWAGLHGAFLFDDYVNIVHNAAIHMNTFSIDSLREALSGAAAGPLGRPVSVLSFALTHFFFGLNPFAFKSLNLLIHFGNSLLLFFIFVRLLSAPDRNAQYVDRLAFVLALLWLLHPINLTPVLMAVQRMTLLATSFCLLSLLCHLRGMQNFRQRGWLWLVLAWGVLWPLAFLSKESALVLPVLALVSSAYMLRAQAQVLRVIRWLAVAVLALMLGALVWGWSWLQSAYMIRAFSLEERLLTQARVLWRYLELIILPRFKSFAFFWDDFGLSHSLLSPATTALAVLAWLGVLILVLFLRRSLPLFSFGVSWFLIGHLLESTVIPLEIAFEHRNYLPAIGLLLAFVALAEKALVRSGTRYPEKCLLAFLAVFVCYAAALTWGRSAHFSDSLRFATMEVAYHPESSRANVAAAVALMDAGYGAEEDFSAQAIRLHLLRAAELDQHNKHAPLYLMVWACGTERLVETEWLKMLTVRLSNSPFAPADVELPARMGKLIFGGSNCLHREQVKALFSAAAYNQRVRPAVRANFLEVLADYELLVSGDINSAKALLEQALVLDAANLARKNKLRGLKGG